MSDRPEKPENGGESEPSASAAPFPLAAEDEAIQLFFAGNAHLAAGEDEPAMACLRRALALRPGFAEASANLAWLLDRAGQSEAAERQYRHAIACDPDIGLSHLNFGAFLLQQKRLDEAEAALRAALALMPEAAMAWSNLGMLQACRQQEEAAEASYRTALALDPEYRNARFNLSYLLLRQGRFDEGWFCLEARNWYFNFAAYFAFPRWRGENPAGRALLIVPEAGQGDMIQFCRYAAWLKARGAARVGVVCHPPLTSLLRTLPGVDAVMALDGNLAATGWDYWVQPLSLPYLFQTRIDSIPAALPYLHADSGRVADWAAVLAPGRRQAELCVGLVWKGNPRFDNDGERSLPGLTTLAPLGELADVRFVSLQKGAGEDEAARAPGNLTLFDAAPRIADFADTAAVVAHLDLVISVDTAVAHLAGALGKPCWVMLPAYQTDWRWLKEREDSPWYPGCMRLFRQPRPGDWSSVVAALRQALLVLLEERRQGLAPSAPVGE